MKSRFAFSALVFLVAMTMATGAFAQGIFTLSAGSSARGRSNGYAERAGGITLFLTTGSIGVGDEGTVVINYGVPITNDIADDGDNAIDVSLCQDGRLADVEDSPVAVNNDKGTITITLDGDGGETPCAATQSINVDNVLVSLVGSGATSVSATVTSTGDVRLGGANGNRLTVIDSVVDPLTDDNVKVGQKLTLIRHTGKLADSEKNQFHLVITEAHVDSFDNAQLELTFSGMPEDVEVVELDAWVTTKKNFDLPKGAEGKVDTDNEMNRLPVGGMTNRAANADKDGEATVFLQVPLAEVVEDDGTDAIEARPAGGELMSNAVDVVVVRGSIKGADDEDLLPIDLDIQVTVDLGPTGDEDDFNATIKPVVFGSDETTPMTVIESTPSRTTLKVPFVLTDGTFDTGIAVSNMSSGGGAQPGAITFDFYVGGTKMSHTTSASSPGSGLNESGQLMPGSTYAILLSQLFPGNPGGGYLIITTDFTSGDGNVFISDFAGFSATGSVRQPE